MRRKSCWIAARCLLIAFGLLSVLSFGASQMSTEKLIYSFKGTPDGSGPSSDLTSDAEGNLYGTTIAGGTSLYYGTVFELKRTANGWKEEVLYSFADGNDGAEPQAGVIFDAAGNLYGTTLYGGPENDGTVFELLRGVNGVWTEKELHTFGDDTDGAFPYAGLTIDPAGNLYGTTAAGGTREHGTVFELTPGNNGTWTEKVLHNFSEPGGYEAGPFGGLAMDAAGNLYGTTYGGGVNRDDCDVSEVGCGRVFELTPAANGRWIEKTLHLFNGKDGANPWAGVVLDKAGNLYGITYWGGTGRCLNGYGKINGCGVVFSLTPSTSGTWTENVLHNFDNNGFDGFNSFAGLALDTAGNLYGTTGSGGTRGAGTVFKVTKRTDGEWSEKVVYNFGRYGDGSDPQGPVIVDATGNLLGTTEGGGDYRQGTVFEITP
jgi:uncharacterized repeat protein (TIGR03803 family)